jgi:hypothetical protein
MPLKVEIGWIQSITTLESFPNPMGTRYSQSNGNSMQAMFSWINLLDLVELTETFLERKT